MKRAGGALLLAATLALLAGCTAPREHVPWTPLSLQDPIGWATKAKLRALPSDPDACAAALATAPDAGTEACPLAGARVLERAALVYGDALPMTCALAAAVYVWEREVVAPAAATHLGTSVARVNQAGTFACRTVAGSARISENASANALDVTGFVLDDGRRIAVLADWGQPTPQGRFLAAVRDGSCGIFADVLGPDYNAAHRDHLHLDLGPYEICR